MTFLARVFKFLFWIVVVSWGIRLLGRLFSGLLQPDKPNTSSASGTGLSTMPTTRLVRDPICGVHIAESLAISLQRDGNLLHFCSMSCRDSYLGSSRKLAANA